jgi:leader peptidase (prepilin peptidase) / N-methyltransferase
LESFLECVLFVIGLAFGSFLNVCISRIPHDESVVSPRSHCPTCGAAIRWYDNLPLLSWLLLHRRCRDCGWRIPWRYPVVELLTAVLFVACLVWFGPTWLTLKFCVFSFLILGLIFMDAETGLLPREFTYPGIALGLAFSWIAPTDSAGTQFLLSLYNQYWGNVQRLSLLDSALGAALGAGFLYVAWGLYYLVRKKHGMGFGDIALLAMSGAFLGLKLTLFVIFTAPLLALICTMLLLVSGAGGSRSADASQGEVKAGGVRAFFNREIPFGVFLGVCSLAAMLIGELAWQWYLRIFQ